jgi:hypothetical protein
MGQGGLNHASIQHDRRLFAGSACQNLPAGRTPHGPAINNDGWTLAMGHNDDGTVAYTIPFAFTLYGQSFTDSYINNNGNLSFPRSYQGYSASGFPMRGTAMIAPFWGDVDTRPEQGGHVWRKMIRSNVLAVSWDEVGYYSYGVDKLNTFQVLISDGADASMGIGNNICFCYENMDWTTGDASSGSGGLGGIPATVGANAGDGSAFFQFGRFNAAGDAYDGPNGNYDGIDYLDEKSFCFDATGAGNIPPIAANFPVEDTVYLEACESLDLELLFLSPESSQTTSVVVSGAPNDMDIQTTSGNTGTVKIQWDRMIEETVELTIVATDNFSTPGVTTKVVTINVVDCPSATPAPTSEPSSAPTSNPSSVPSTEPSASPSSAPSSAPSAEPSASPSSAPTSEPSTTPSSAPSFESISHDVCENFAVHARTTVTFAGAMSTVHGGDMGVSPGTSITGSYTFDGEGQHAGGMVLDSSDFAASVLVAHAAAMEVRADENAMEIEIGGLTFTPGTYRSGSAINFAYGTVVTLDGLNATNPVFLFQAGSTLVTAADTSFILKNGAKAENVYWALGAAATLGANSVLEGSILAGTAITFGTKSALHGCALAQSAVTFESEGSVEPNHYIGDDN